MAEAAAGVDHPEMAAATTVKLPVFWPSDPELWFAQVEAQFTTRNITADSTKFNHLVASLTPETAAEVRDVLLRPPAQDKYKALKEKIIARTTHSEQARLKQLLTAAELEGRKPSQLLRHMRQLVGNSQGLVSDELLKQLFVPRLPTHVQIVLASNDAMELDKMAEMADKLMDVISPHTINAVDSRSEVADLRKEIQEIKSLLRGRANEKAPTKGPRNRSKTPASRVEDPTGMCWYHAKFGEKAQKCRPECTFKPGNAARSH